MYTTMVICIYVYYTVIVRYGGGWPRPLRTYGRGKYFFSPLNCFTGINDLGFKIILHDTSAAHTHFSLQYMI